MKKLLTLLFLSFGLVTFGQVYQLMPQYGYQANRMRFDSTLQIPTVCGVPTLKSNVTKLGAIAFDSCNNRFYTYNPKTAVWSQVSGGGGSTDTSSLSARINLKIDSVKRRTDSVFAYRNGTEVFQFRDSIRPIDTPTTVIMTVVNATGTTLTKGEVVYLFGATGSTASVKRANNKSDSTSSKTIGIVRRDIAAGATGTVTTQGQVEKLNLGAYNEGDILYLDSIDGQLTKVKPLAPYHQVFIGVVERANNGNGLMYIKPQNGYELGELHNVSVNNERQNSVFYFDSTNRVWKAQSAYNLVDTTKLSARIDLRFRISDTSTMLTPYLRKTDTASLSTRIDARLRITDTSVFLRKADTTSLSTRIVNSGLSTVQLYRRLGSASKSIVPMNGSVDLMSANFTMTDGNQWFYTFYLDRNDTLKGVRFFMRTQGSYTADNYNGVALYTMSGGTLTLVDSSTNDGNIWKSAANAWGNKDFVFPYPATEGFYVISFISNWTGTPAATPIIGGITTLINGNARSADFSNGYSLGYNSTTRANLLTSVVASTLTYIAPAPILLIY